MENLSHRHKQLICCWIMRHMTKFSYVLSKFVILTAQNKNRHKNDWFDKFRYVEYIWNQLKNCFKMICNMLFIKLNLKSMISSWSYRKIFSRRKSWVTWKYRSRYLWYINESKVETWIYWLSFEISSFCCFWGGLLKPRLMTSSAWLIKFDLRKVKFRPSSY